MKKNIFISLVFSILISEPITAQTKANNPFGNALIPDMIADASIQEIEGMFYRRIWSGARNFRTTCCVEVK